MSARHTHCSRRLPFAFPAAGGNPAFLVFPPVASWHALVWCLRGSGACVFDDVALSARFGWVYTTHVSRCRCVVAGAGLEPAAVRLWACRPSVRPSRADAKEKPSPRVHGEGISRGPVEPLPHHANSLPRRRGNVTVRCARYARCVFLRKTKPGSLWPPGLVCNRV